MGAATTVERERQRALDLAFRALSARERTVAELRTFLEGKRVEPEAIDHAVCELQREGYLDDARYANRFAEDKRLLQQWGMERIVSELGRRGVARELIDRIARVRDRTGELQAAQWLLGERFPRPLRDDRDRQRAWSLLVRRGYGTQLAYDAVRAHDGDPP